MFTIVIPTYSITDELAEMAVRCLKSYKNQCDRIIVCEDGMNYSDKLRQLSDVYIYNKQNVGFTANVNRGWKCAEGDFVGIVSSDTYLISGNLRDLCIPGKITSPIIENQSIENLAGPFWVTSKEALEKYGYLNETMKTYYSDTEYDERVRDCFQKVPSVVIHHNHAQSVRAAGVEGNMTADREAYDFIFE